MQSVDVTTKEINNKKRRVQRLMHDDTHIEERSQGKKEQEMKTKNSTHLLCTKYLDCATRLLG